MNGGLFFQYPAWFILLCLVLGALYAAVLYFRDPTFDDKSTGSRLWKRIMAIFRFVVVSVLAVLLLSPFIRARHTQTFKPIVAIIHDNSESVRNALKGDSALYSQKLKKLVQNLSQNYDVLEFSAGDDLKKGIDFLYQDKTTNLSDAIEKINDGFYNQNLGAVILASDGIYNRGVNPVYTASKSAYSIYTVALGDTTTQKDQKLSNAYYNKIAYLNDQFSLRVDIEAANLSGKSAKIHLYKVESGSSTSAMQSKEVNYNSDGFFQSMDFVIPADKTGIIHYRLSLTNLEGEATYKNNTRDIFVEVLDGRQKILLVAYAPHPDIAAFKAAIESNRNYQLDVEYAETFARKLNDYNLVILHQLPSATHRIGNILQEAGQLKKPLLFVVGTQTLLPEFSKAQTAINIRGNTERTNEVTATVSKDFALFTISDRTLQTISKLPPLFCAFGDFNPNPASRSLLLQKINSVSTDYPLWLFNETGEVKTGVITGEGIWRWRLHDYLLNKNQDAIHELINKTVQYLSVKGDKRPLRVTLPKNIFQDNEVVTFDAQLYNANYEPVNTPDLNLLITGEEEKEYRYRFNRSENVYNLNAGFLPVGNYSYEASVQFGNTMLRTNGKFSVSPLQVEEMRTRADHQVLYQLASQHKGSMHYISDMDKIADEINSANQLKPVLYDTFTTESALYYKWILFLLLLLLSAEWFMRKYMGGY